MNCKLESKMTLNLSPVSAEAEQAAKHLEAKFRIR